MSLNSFGHLFRVTTGGESHGPAIGCVIDGCPPGIAFSEAELQAFLDKRKPGQSRFVTQRREADAVRVLSGAMPQEDGTFITTGTPISLMIENTDQRSKDYSEIAKRYRPAHADSAKSPSLTATLNQLLALSRQRRVDFLLPMLAVRFWRPPRSPGFA